MILFLKKFKKECLIATPIALVVFAIVDPFVPAWNIPSISAPSNSLNEIATLGASTVFDVDCGETLEVPGTSVRIVANENGYGVLREDSPSTCVGWQCVTPLLWIQYDSGEMIFAGPIQSLHSYVPVDLSDDVCTLIERAMLDTDGIARSPRVDRSSVLTIDHMTGAFVFRLHIYHR